MTIRDVRLHWPLAEKALARGGEIIVTRDGQPVARLLPCPARPRRARPRFKAQEHLTWLTRLWKGQHAGPSTDDLLAKDRAD